MATYFTNEGAFDLPEVGFTDRTVHLFEATDEAGDLGLMIVRTNMPEGKSLRELVEAHIIDEAKKLGGFKILEQREAFWAGVPAIEICSRWRSDGQVMYQRQVHLAAQGLWLLFASTAPLAEQVACDKIMDHVLTSFRLHSAG